MNKLVEYHLYGSSAQGRFATWKPDNINYDVTLNSAPSSSTVNRTVSQKEFEVKDHLGNVRLVFSDLKDVNIGTTTRYRYNLDVRAINNYYPFGMLMPDMSWQSSGYRYGYNGMEMDNDIKGTGNHLSTHFRGLDPRVVRWGSPDPAEKSYPGRSSYVSMGNNPVNNLDPNGDDEYKFNSDGTLNETIENENDDTFFVENGFDENNNKTFKQIDLEIDDVGVLSRIVYAEARGENKDSKDLVAKIVQNRVNAKSYPDTYKGVVEQNATVKKGFKVYQFTSVNPNDNNFDEYSTPLNNGKANKAFIESLQSSIKTINDLNDIVDNNTILYYSPKSMIPKNSEPKWNFKILEETTPEEIDKNSFRTFKYKK